MRGVGVVYQRRVIVMAELGSTLWGTIGLNQILNFMFPIIVDHLVSPVTVVGTFVR